MIPRVSEAPHSTDRVLFASPVVRVGVFHADAEHPLFAEHGPMPVDVVALPRTAYHRLGAGRPAVADATSVFFHNRGSVLRRRPIHGDGAICEWYAPGPEVLSDVLRSVGESDERERRPFRVPAVPVAPRLYLRHRLLFRALQAGETPEPLEVEETVLALLASFLRTTVAAPAARRAPFSPRAEREAAEAARLLLASRFAEPLPLARLAAEVGVSVFFLCRAFRRQFGMTMHRYRRQLRLREAVRLICDSSLPLTDIALETGFSSHSHLTAAFHRLFGVPPSQLRAHCSAERGTTAPKV
jgi:AraC-like DNA-binding protein